MTSWPPRPMLGTSFYKAHGLGNDYLVFEQGDAWRATEEGVARVCDPHRGVGSDGIVVLLSDRSGGVARLRMFNPDGGEFERSGNGLRVLGSYLAGRGESGPWTVSVGGDEVRMTLLAMDGATFDLSVEMGRARLGPDAVGLDATALDPGGRLSLPGGPVVEVVPVSVGNPHLVIPTPEAPRPDALEEIGRAACTHPALANGSNVQLAFPSGPGRCSALVWERGVGPTQASGTSACAVAAAMVATGRLEPGEISVDMPGGSLFVGVTPELDLTLRGPIEAVCEGRLLG